MNMKTISWSKSKLVLLGSVLFLSSFFFGGQAKATTCTWTAGAASTSLFSDQLNWNGGTGCSFSAPATSLLIFSASSTKNVVFDLSTTTPTIVIDSAYTGVATVTSSVTVTSTGGLSAQGGLAGIFTIASGGTLIVGTNVSVSSSASFQVEGTLKIGGNFTVTSTLTSAAGTVIFTSTTAQTISGPGTIAFYNLNIASGGNTVTASSSITTNGNLTISSGNTFAMGSSSLIAAGNIANSGTFTQSSGTSTLTGTSATIGGSGNTTFYNLSVEGIEILAGNVTTTNNLTLTSITATLSLGTNNLVVSSTFTNDGIVSQTSGSVTMSGVGSLVGTGSTQLVGLIITGTTTLDTDMSASTTVVSGVFNGGTDGDVLTLTGAGSPLTITGTFNPSAGKIKYSGVSNITTSTTYFNLESSGTQSLNGNITVGANFTSTAGSVTQATGTVSMTGNAYVLGGVGSMTLYNVTVATTSLNGNVTTTNLFTVNGQFTGGTRTLTLTATGTPFVINTGAIFAIGTSNITYSGANINIASTTYYNLTLNSSASSSIIASTTVMNTLTISNGILYEPGNDFLTLLGTGTPLSNSSAAHISTTSQRINLKYGGSEVNVAGGTYYNLTIDSASSTLIGDITVPNILTVNSGKTLNGSSYTINLSVAGTPFALAGTFVASNSNVNYTGATVTIATTTYATLTLGTGTYTFVALSVTTTVAMVNNGTLDVGNGRKVIILSGTYTNNATTTLNTSGQIVKAATGGFSGAPYISGSANGTGNTFSIIINDPIANLLAGSVETSTVTITNSTNSDSESVTLTETGAATGVFSGSIPFNIANTAASNSKIDVSGNGTLSLSGYTKPTPPTVYSVGTLSDVVSASYTGSTYSTGGGIGGGGSAPSVTATGAASVTSAQTTSQTITLNLSATNATQVAISEDQGFAGASWDTYTPTKSFTLSSGAGEKTIYVKFRSASGGVTATYKVNVTLKPDYVPSQVVTPAVSTSGEVVTPVVTAVAQFEVSNPDSKVVIAPVKTLVYKPNSVVKYTYAYKNETTKTVKVKIVRSVVDANGKVVTKVTGSASITKGKTYKFNASSPLSNKVAEGNYTVKVQILDFKTGKLIDENSFAITVKKPLPPPTITSNNPYSKVVITGLKLDYKPGNAVKYTYAYKNETTKTVKVKIVRSVVDENGKVVTKVTGSASITKGKTFKFNATNSLSSKLPVGTYTVKVQILDTKNVVLDENGFDFVVKK